jgi:hypothetical protein
VANGIDGRMIEQYFFAMKSATLVHSFAIDAPYHQTK